MLSDWDRRLEAHSAAAALFEIWFRSHLRPALFADALTDHIPAEKLGQALELLVNQANVTGDARIDLGLIDHAGITPQAAHQLDGILESTLAAAMNQLEDLLGPDSTAWQWGALHQADLEHPLMRADSTRPPMSWTGSARNPGAAAETPWATPRMAQPASPRPGVPRYGMVLDVGAWDNSLAMNSPGNRVTSEVLTTRTSSPPGHATRASPCCTPASESRPSPNTVSC